MQDRIDDNEGIIQKRSSSKDIYSKSENDGIKEISIEDVEVDGNHEADHQLYTAQETGRSNNPFIVTKTGDSIWGKNVDEFSNKNNVVTCYENAIDPSY